MSNELKSNPKLDKAISEATSQLELRSILHDEYEGRQGLISHARGDETVWTTPEHPHFVAPTVPAPALPDRSNFGSARRTIYPHGNLRVELSGVDEEALDLVEERLRAAFQR